MPILSAKRQVTLPKALCDRLGVRPGDRLGFLEHDGRITIIKKVTGASAGVLSHLVADERFTDEESRKGFIAGDASRKKRKRAPTHSRRKTSAA